MNDRYEHATLQLISPEVRTEPVIVPWGLYFHTHGFNATSQAIGRYFDNDTVNVESTFSGAEDGKIYQFQYWDRQADAQAAANGFMLKGRLHGGTSVESEDRGDPRRPWTEATCVSFGLLAATQHLRYGLELALATAPRQNRISYHSQFKENNPNGHACPGPVRVAQLPHIIDIAKWLLAAKAPKNTDIVDELRYPTGEHWRLQRDGGVVTVAGGKFWGSYPGLGIDAGAPRTFGTFEARADKGYNLISTSKERYQFPGRG